MLESIEFFIPKCPTLLRSFPSLPMAHDLADRFIQADADVPLGVVLAHLGEITDVADVIADAVLIHVLEHLGLAGMLLGDLERLPDRAGIGAAATEVVHLRHPGLGNERLDEARHIVGVDVVAHLLTLIAEHLIQPPLQVALHQITQKAMQLHPAVVRPGEAAAPQAAAGQAEIAAVFLHHHVRRQLRRPEQRVLALVDREILGDAVAVGRIVVVPAALQFLQRDAVRPVAIHLVGGEVHKRALGAALARGLQQVERAHRVGVEVVEGDRRCPVVAGLGRRVHDRRGLQLGQQGQHPRPVADVQLGVLEVVPQLLLQALLVPAGVALRPEEHRPLVVVHPHHPPAALGEVHAHLRADQA